MGYAPKNLATKLQLKHNHLKPTGKPCGCVITEFHQFVMLYDKSETRAIKPESEARKAARLATWQKTQEKWKCLSCGNKPADIGELTHYWFKPGQCDNCREMAVFQAEQDDLEAMLEEDRQGAIQWARALLARKDWCILDTETTGLDGVVIELAIIAPGGETLFNSRINPDGIPVSRQAEAIHGLSTTLLASAPTLPEVWPGVLAALAERKTIVTYNSAFDKARMEQSAARYGLALPGGSWECAMEAYAEFYGSYSEYHHSYTWQPLDGGHNALSDCLACRARLINMANCKIEGE
jgi:DNA polymerase III epsilon subunit-like protein